MTRLIDIAVSIALLVLLSPLLIVAALLLSIFQRGQVLFIQERPGLKGVLFKILKFKTMADRYDSNGQLLPDHERLTPVGQVIRKLSIDELPQLINVLKGEMSLVGPRPLLPEYLPLYSAQQARRHEVKPGITGWAQVNGRNAISWQQRFDYDVWFVDHYSLQLYLKILWLTLGKVLKREGITESGHVSMTKFQGN
jgi:lipopolysaccharide/colanic/teichoic acid biosynthesis glycosyltransferase